MRVTVQMLRSMSLCIASSTLFRDTPDAQSAVSIRHSADVKVLRESVTLACHASAAFRAFAAGAGAFFHPIQFFATFRASVANSGADTADMVAQPGTAQHEI